MSLDREKIVRALPKAALPTCLVFDDLPSTNDYLIKHLAEYPCPTAVLTDHQTHGRGRQQRTWVMPKGSGIALSYLLDCRGNVSGLSLAVGVMMLRALKKMGATTLELKWPNDILYHGEKLCGILVEVQHSRLIIGIGMNIKLPKLHGNPPWTDLTSMLNKPVDPNAVAATILNQLIIDLPTFEQDGLAPFIMEWNHADLLMGQILTVTKNTRKITGICQGISPQGALLLDDGNETLRLFSADVHIGS